MSAMTEHTTTQLASTTSNRANMISHDPVNHVITVEVMVTQPPGTSPATIFAPPITVPSGTWTVNWDLVVTTPGLVAKFDSPGIAVSTKHPPPPKVTVVSPPAAVSPQRWTIQLQNDVSDANAFNYGIRIFSPSGTRGPEHMTTVHDPTIAVVKDPVDPPPTLTPTH